LEAEDRAAGAERAVVRRAEEIKAEAEKAAAAERRRLKRKE
jgi:hypothetical protein